MLTWTRQITPHAVITCGCLALVLMMGCRKVVVLSHTDSQWTAQQLRRLASYLEADALPRGDRRELEMWLEDKWNDPDNRPEMKGLFLERRVAIMKVSDEGHVELRDTWGHLIIYQYPSEDARYMYRLYSVGPNGIDEGGGGDDIDVSPAAPEPAE